MRQLFFSISIVLLAACSDVSEGPKWTCEKFKAYDRDVQLDGERRMDVEQFLTKYTHPGGMVIAYGGDSHYCWDRSQYPEGLMKEGVDPPVDGAAWGESSDDGEMP